MAASIMAGVALPDGGAIMWKWVLLVCVCQQITCILLTDQAVPGVNGRR